MIKLSITEVFSAKVAAQLSGLSLTMLDYLVREDFVIPSGTGPRGRGNPRRFTFSDLVLLKVVARLLASGIEIRRLAKALRGLKSRFDDPAALAGRAQYLLSDGTDVYLIESGGLESLTSNRQMAFAFVVDLGACRREIEVMRQSAFNSSSG
jgi:DNA-binding transcriptional MerR regulator